MKAPVIEKRFHDPNLVAKLNRDVLSEAKVLGVRLCGGPGCGKTTRIEATLLARSEEVTNDSTSLHSGG